MTALSALHDDGVRVGPALAVGRPHEGIHKPSLRVLTTAELAECTCPDWCERDHEND